jgi:hypothetical protein
MNDLGIPTSDQQDAPELRRREGRSNRLLAWVLAIAAMLAIGDVIVEHSGAGRWPSMMSAERPAAARN